jgi:hypothetical protein
MKWSRSLLFAAPCAVVLALLGVSPATAAKPPSVTITSPAAVASGPADVTVTGKATLPALHSLRVQVSTQGDSYMVQPTAKGAWSVQVSGLILGPTTMCANVYDSGGGYVTGDCVTYTVLPTPDRFTIDTPSEGSEVTTPLVVTGACEYGEFIAITTDVGVEWGTTCEFYTRTWSAPLEGVPDGPLTITASAQGLDGNLVATRTVHVTIVPLPAPQMQILEPSANQTLYIGQVATVSGTAVNTTGVEVFLNGTTVGYSTVEPDGSWSIVFFPEQPGDARICARGQNADGETETCVDVVVSVDPGTLGIATPTDGLVTNVADLEVSGSCAEATTVTIEADDTAGAATVPCEGGGFTTTLTGLPDGPRVITATMAWDGAPVVSRQVTVTMDTTAPPSPTVTSPTQGSTLTMLPVTLTGTAEAGSVVQVLHSDHILYTEAVTSSTGTWSVVLERDYFSYEGVLTGRRATASVTVLALDDVGNASPTTTTNYTTRLG